MWRLKFAACVALALLPSWLKIPLYRLLFGYRIGKRVRIGFSPFFGVGHCRIGDYASIGSFNLFFGVAELDIGDYARIGLLNLFRGGQRVRIGNYSTIARLNVFNSIIERDFVDPVEPVLELGTGVVVTSGHWLDFSAGLGVGDHSMIGGRNSTFWTHHRQCGRPISVGCHCCIGSEVRVAPGTVVPPFCIVALGSVLSGQRRGGPVFGPPRSLIGGNPAAVVRTLRERELFLVTRKTRNDIPDDVASALLPDELRAAARRAQGVIEVEGACPVG